MNKTFEPTSAELISLEGRFHVLAESMPQLVWSAQADGTVDYFNRQWIAYTGLTVEAAAGRSLKGVVHPDDLARMWELWDKAIQTSEPYEIEYRLRCAADGSYKWFIARAMPLLNNEGKAVRWIGTATDIDEQKRAIESERYTTAILQRALLPSLLPNSKGLRFDAVYLQASKNAEVGGDWYDAIELDDGAVVISIGDVTGKGLEAAVIMNKVRHAMDIVPLHERNPEKILDAADWFLRKRYPEAIVTGFVAVISPDRKSIRYANAGHPYPLLRRDTELIELRAVGLPIGLRFLRDSQKSSCCEVQPGDVLVLYTDGLVEWGRDWDEGERRLRAAVSDCAFAESATPAQFLAPACTSQLFRDDVAILTVTFQP